MRDNKRKLLAVATAVLAVSFLLPTFRTGRGGSDMVVGHAGKTELTYDMTRRAKFEIDTLKRVSILGDGPRGPEPRLLMNQRPEWAALVSTQDDNYYALLQLDAQRLGIAPDETQLESIYPLLSVRDETVGGFTPLDSLGASAQNNVKQALRNLLAVHSAATRTTSMSKTSKPFRGQLFVKQFAMLKLQAVDINVASPVATTAPTTLPTQDVIAEHFKKYADVAPGGNDFAVNPFGFGYQQPDRVKLQYVEIPRAAVKAAVRRTVGGKYTEAQIQEFAKQRFAANPQKYSSTQPGNAPTATRPFDDVASHVLEDVLDYEWSVAAQNYYAKHTKEFEDTPKKSATTSATSQPADALTLGASSTPTTRPFVEVESDIVEKLVNPEADKLAKQIQTRVAVLFSGDFAQYRAAASTSQPATQTAVKTALGVPYDSSEYLTAVQAEIARQFRVNLTLKDLGREYRSEADLENLNGIGTAGIYAQSPDGPQQIRFADYAIHYAETFLDPKQTNVPFRLRTWEQSQPLTDDERNVYIFRLTAAAKHEPAASIESVAGKIAEDLKRQAAFESAKQSAQPLLSTASANGLSKTPLPPGEHVIDIGPIDSNPRMPIMNYPLLPSEQVRFVEQAYNLLGGVTDGTKPVVGVIELPRSNRLLVVQIVETMTKLPPDLAGVAELRAGLMASSELARPLIEDWYSLDSVIKRLDYHDDRQRRSN